MDQGNEKSCIIDKTYQEIKNAYDAGRTIIANVTDSHGNYLGISCMGYGSNCF
jgi:hypothetical protein